MSKYSRDPVVHLNFLFLSRVSKHLIDFIDGILTDSTYSSIGVNRPAPAFWLISRFPAFLRERPAILALFRNNKNR